VGTCSVSYGKEPKLPTWRIRKIWPSRQLIAANARAGIAAGTTQGSAAYAKRAQEGLQDGDDLERASDDGECGPRPAIKEERLRGEEALRTATYHPGWNG